MKRRQHRSIAFRLFAAVLIAGMAISAMPIHAAHALACAAIASGPWNVPATWSCAAVPGIGDTVTIGTPFTVTLANNESATNVTINTGGTLALASFTLTLSSASTGMTVNGGGILNAGTGIVTDTAPGGAPFTLASGGILQTANLQGIATGVVLTGSIQSRGLRTYSTGANYVYNGTANQVVGTGLTQNTPANLTINNPGNIVSLGAPTTISGSLIMTAGSLNLAANATTVGDVQGAANITSNTAGTVTLTTGSNNANTAYSGVLSNGSGTVALTKVGTGALTLSGNNTYGGTTTLSAGTLNINSPTAIGAGTFTINAGTINNTSGAAITLANNNPQNWNGNFTFTGTNNLNLGTGAVAMNAARTVTVNGSTLIVGGVIGGAFRLTKTGVAAGTLTLNAANTHSGTTLTAGILNIGNAQALGNPASVINLNGGSIDNTTGAALTLVNYPYSIGGNITFVGTNNLNLGTGAVTLTGNRQITVTANTLTVGGAISGAFGLTKAGAGVLLLNAPNTYTGTTTVSLGTLQYGIDNALPGGGVTVSGGTLSLGTYSDSVGTVTLTAGTITGTTGILTGTSYALQAGTVSAILGGTGMATKTTAGTVTLSGANTFTGGTTLSAGTLNINSATAIGAGTFTIGAGTIINNTSGAAITLTNNNPQNWNGNFTFTGTNSLDLGTGAVTMSAARTVTVNASTLTVGGVISGTGFRLTKAGVGALTLSGTNTFTGGTTLSAGTLNINNAQALGTVAGTFIITGGTIGNTSGAAITTLNYPQNWNGNFAFAGTSDLNLGTGAVTMSAARTVTVNANMLTVGGVIAGAFRLTKTGNGTLTLTGANTHSGTTLAAGTLNINNAQALGNVASAFIITSGTIDNTSGAALITLNYPQNWNGNFTFIGTSDLNLGTGAVTMSAARTVTVNASTLTVGGVISGAGFRLTKAGVGALTLSGTNTFTGGTTLSAGTLNINSTQALGTVAGTFIITGGTIDNTSGAALATLNYPQNWNGNFIFTGTNNLNLGTGAVTMNAARTVTVTANTLTVGGVISGAGFRLTKAGAGVLTLSGTNTFTGGATLSAGTLNINNTQALGTVAGTFIINGGTIDNTSGATITTLNYPQTWGGDFAFTGTNNLNLGNGAVTLTGNRTATVNGNTLTVGGAISPNTFDLTKTGAGILSFGSNAVNLRSLTISAGTLVSTSGTMSLAGNFTNNGIYTHNNGTILFNGGSPQSITGATTFNNLTLNNANGLAINSTETVNGVLTFTNGRITTGANILIIGTGGSVAGSAAGRYVYGFVQKNFPVAAGQSFTFPIGDATNYTPVLVTGLTVTTTGGIVASTTAGEHPNIATSGIDPAKDVNRYWTLTPVGGLVITPPYSATFNFVAGDVDTGANTNNFLVKRYSSGWSAPTTGTRTATSAQATVIPGFGDFAVGEWGNVPPVITSNGGGPTAAINIPENTTAVTTVTATDPDVPPQTLTYSIVGGADSTLFTIGAASGVLAFIAPPNFEFPSDTGSNNVYDVTVQVSDGNGGTDTQAISVTVTDVNEGPTDITLSNNTVAENQPVNTVVGALSATDPDAGATFTFSLTCAVPGAGDASFNINGTDLRTSVSFNYEVQNTYSICIRVTDQGGLTYDENFTIDVIDVNEGPTDINLSSSSVDENQPLGTAVGTLSSTDPDSADTFTYSLVIGGLSCPGTDNASFSISGDVLETAAVFDYETQNSYTICIRTTDSGGLTFDKQFTILVIDLDENSPTVTIDQAAGQVDPANISPINFTAVFSEAVSGFTGTNVTLSGTALPTVAVVSEIAPNDGTTYNVAVSGMTGFGTVTASINAGVVTDAAGNGNIASTSTDNTVTFDPDYPVVLFDSDTTPANGSTLMPGPIQITIAYSEDVKNDGSAGAANTIANYLLVESGLNAAFNTISCMGGPVADDTQVTIDSAVYTNNGGSGPFVATLIINGGTPLPVGNYRLFICGTTSIEDLADNELNDGLSDTVLNFRVAAPSSLPSTGFPKDKVTSIPPQPAELTYLNLGSLWVEIPSLNVKASIVGVPETSNGWDVTWLGDDIGWLNGTAFPSWEGNSVLTAHVTNANGLAGPFARLKDLKYGDRIVVHLLGEKYIFEVRNSRMVTPSSTSFAMEDLDGYSYLTLITCQGYNDRNDSYRFRRVVRAVLIEVQPDKVP